MIDPMCIQEFNKSDWKRIKLVKLVLLSRLLETEDQD